MRIGEDGLGTPSPLDSQMLHLEEPGAWRLMNLYQRS